MWLEWVAEWRGIRTYALDTYPILADLVAKNSPHGDLLQQASSGNAHQGKSLPGI